MGWAALSRSPNSIPVESAELQMYLRRSSEVDCCGLNKEA